MPLFNDWGERANSVAVVNSSNEAIPPGAIVVSAGDPDADGRKRVGKPASDGQPGCMIVGAQGILPANTTEGVPVGWATFDTPALAAFDPADGVPAIGEEWGPAAGSWLLRKGRPGFRIDGAATAEGDRVVVVRSSWGGTIETAGVTRPVVDMVRCDGLGNIVSRYTLVYGPTLPTPPTGVNVIQGTVTVDAVAAPDREIVASYDGYEWRGTTDAGGNYTITDLPGGTYVVLVIPEAGETGAIHQTVTVPTSPATADFSLTT